MSYTIPEYVDTQEQAILAVASAVKGEQVTGGDGSVNTALDILADALAGENVTVPMTQQGAILALAQYVAGMVKPEGTITITENGECIDVAQYATADVSVSGGGVDVGPLVDVMYRSVVTPQPAVGDAVDLTADYNVAAIKIGDTTIADCTINSQVIYSGVGFAAGTTLTTIWMPAFDDPTKDAAYAYTYTVETVEEVDYYKTVTILEDAVTMETNENSEKRYTYTVPEVGDGTFFAVSYVGNWD